MASSKKQETNQHEWKGWNPRGCWGFVDPDSKGAVAVFADGELIDAITIEPDRRIDCMGQKPFGFTVPNTKAVIQLSYRTYGVQAFFVEKQQFRGREQRGTVSEYNFFSAIEHASKCLAEIGNPVVLVEPSAWHNKCRGFAETLGNHIAIPDKRTKADSLGYALTVYPEYMALHGRPLASGIRKGLMVYRQSVADAICIGQNDVSVMECKDE